MLDGKLALLLLNNAAAERQARSLLAVCYLWRDRHLTLEVHPARPCGQRLGHPEARTLKRWDKRWRNGRIRVYWRWKLG